MHTWSALAWARTSQRVGALKSQAQGTPAVNASMDWGSLTPLQDGGFGPNAMRGDAIPTLADSVNRELAALHQVRPPHKPRYG